MCEGAEGGRGGDITKGPAPSQEWLQGRQVGHQVWPGEGCARGGFGLSLPGGCLPPLGTWDCCPQLYSTLRDGGRARQEWSSAPTPNSLCPSFLIPKSAPILPPPASPGRTRHYQQ